MNDADDASYFVHRHSTMLQCNPFRLYEVNAWNFEPSSSKLKWLTNSTYCIRKIYRNLIPLFDWMSFSLIIIVTLLRATAITVYHYTLTRLSV